MLEKSKKKAHVDLKLVCMGRNTNKIVYAIANSRHQFFANFASKANSGYCAS